MISRLFKAVENGNLGEIESLITDEHLNVNARAESFEGFYEFTNYQHYLDFFHRHTPLFVAIFREDLTTTLFLLEKGAKTENIDNEGQSALEVIFRYNSYNSDFDKFLSAILLKSLNLDGLPVQKIIDDYEARGFDISKYNKIKSFGILGCCEAILRADYSVVYPLLTHFKITSEQFKKYLEDFPRNFTQNQQTACHKLLDTLKLSQYLTEDEANEFKTVIDIHSEKLADAAKDEEIKRLKEKLKKLHSQNDSLQYQLSQLNLKNDVSAPQDDSINCFNFFSKPM